MALIKCPECGKEISDQAISCPNCGSPMKKEKPEVVAFQQNSNMVNTAAPKKKKGHGCLITVLAVFIFIGIMAAAVGGAVEHKGKISENNTTDAKITKEDAETLDDEVWKRVADTINVYNEILKGIDGCSNGTVSELDLYNYCKEADEYLGKISVSYPRNDEEDIAPYIQSCITYTLNVQLAAKTLAEYIDDPKTSKLSEVDECLNNAQEAMDIVAGNRGVFLVKMGFSEEEIETIVNKIEEDLE